MGPESSLPHLQLPTICLYPKPDQFSLYPHIQLLEDLSKYVGVFQVVSFPQVSPPKPCMYLIGIMFYIVIFNGGMVLHFIILIGLFLYMWAR
jgi:hypothetical protein